MARKRPGSSPPPPPPPQESSGSGSDEEEEEEEPPRVAATQKPPQNPQPRTPAAAADGIDSEEEEEEEEESDSEPDAQDFQMRPVSSLPAEPAAAAPQPESDDDDDESSESEPEAPEPVQKKAAATNKAKTAEPKKKKRPAPEPAPSGRAKKAKAEVGKAISQTTPAGKGKKAKAEPEKAAPVQTRSAKAKNPGGKPGIDPTLSSKLGTSSRTPRTWSKEDLMKILEAMETHVKSHGVPPKTDVLYAAVGDRLERKNCTPSDLYEKVRSLKRRHEKTVSTGVVPSGEDELRMYNLSEAIWRENATEATAAAAAQNDSATKSKKGQSKKDKMDGNSKSGTLKEVANQNADTQKGSKKGHAMEVSKLSKEHTTTGTPSKSKQQGNRKEELLRDAKSGALKETATQNGNALIERKRGEMDKDKMGVDVMPKDVSTRSQNGGTRAEEETHEEEVEIGASVQGMHRSFDELQNLYPNLAWFVERIGAQHPCGKTMMRASGFIDDEKANALETKIKSLRVSEVKANNAQADLNKATVTLLLGLAD
ncbi:hypothetical protein QOZ80_9AG0679500 [Eleusine coracana subsp. coracana]|nr:hypothetical protein QOZ80_9AG0679500 [Eleusine coracana subsp. coracana]